MKIRIITDSAADFSAEQIEKYGLTIAKMPVNFEGETEEVLDDKDFWKGLIAGKRSLTSQPSQEFLKNEFEKAKANDEQLICIFISAQLSSTYQSAVNVKNNGNYDNVYVIDSKSASVAEKIIVLKAIELRDKNYTAREIYDEVMAFRKRVKLYACVDTLKYLAQSGRISSATANIGSLINIKPIITITEDGHIVNHFKALGINRAQAKLCEMAKESQIDSSYPFLPVFAYDNTNCASFIIKLQAQIPELVISDQTPIGPVIGTHIGPDAFGFAFVEKQAK